MSRKLEILENGLGALQQIMYPQQQDPDTSSADERSIPFLDASSRTPSPASVIGSVHAEELSDTPSRARHSSDNPAFRQSASFPRGRRAPAAPGPRPTDLPAPFTSDFDVASPFPPPVTNGGPFVSPLHHLLSMHESLRDEMGRISSALQELDGRQSMHTLNENLRTREEITYLNAQLAGLSRQVHWLTASQLQRQQSRVGTPGASSSADAGGVEAAVNAVSSATSALSGIARAVGGSGPGDQQGRRRGHSEEGRTKL
ncbi:TRAF-type zinc finger protein [Teratosphaeria destructans]|uniref:TRAF-type zinc finger protein n=1 Tax=Teratosphaeria destructans TaxID=418781 RepID=A0A9W7SW27_9PEZI|nr:TRAF-type zinc finger protein [Teratosphaeria destructans]